MLPANIIFIIMTAITITIIFITLVDVPIS